MTLRTPEGLSVVSRGGLIFCGMGDNGVYQFYNHTEEPCTYLDVSTLIGFDVCDYPNLGKVLTTPSFEKFSKDDKKCYSDDETHILDIGKNLQSESDKGLCALS